MPVGDRRDPLRAHHFIVEIDGIARAGFRECTGLDTRQTPIEYREGNDPHTAQKLPGLVTFSNITLRWGTSDDTQLWDWRQKAIDGSVERKNGSIVMIDDTGSEQARWNFREAWPISWTGPSFNATSNDVAIEALEIAHEGLERA